MAKVMAECIRAFHISTCMVDALMLHVYLWGPWLFSYRAPVLV